MPTRKNLNGKPPTARSWEVFPSLEHIVEMEQRRKLEKRRRHRQVRYLLFRIQNALGKGEDPKRTVPGIPPGFLDFWLGEYPVYLVRPVLGTETLSKKDVPPGLGKKQVVDLGGYEAFAIKWDVDPDLDVYLRWSSVWQEWNATLARVAPILGE